VSGTRLWTNHQIGWSRSWNAFSALVAGKVDGDGSAQVSNGVIEIALEFAEPVERPVLNLDAEAGFAQDEIRLGRSAAGAEVEADAGCCEHAAGHQLGPDDAEIVGGAGIPEVLELGGEPQRLRRFEPADDGVERRQDHAPRARRRIGGSGGVEQLSQRVRRRRPGHPTAEWRE
jgi:hypothetical protein